MPEATSGMVSREGGEQHLVVEYDDEEYHARLRTVYHAEADEERDEYVLEGEAPAPVEAEVTAVNDDLADRGEADPDADEEDEEKSAQVTGDEGEA